MISELKRAFEIGFLLFLPFLVIDLVVASVLMSMGMMMLPPVVISLPFKLIFFVLVDGWRLVAGSLVQSYGTSATRAARDRSAVHSASSRITLIRSDLPSKPMPGSSGMTMWPSSTCTPSGKPP